MMGPTARPVSLLPVHASGARAIPRRERVQSMNKSLMLMIAVALLAASPGHAQRLDLAAVKCRDLLATANKDNFVPILMWLGGYYSEENASPIVDFNTMREHGGRISEHCGRNPGDSVIDAAEKVLGK